MLRLRIGTILIVLLLLLSLLEHIVIRRVVAHFTCFYVIIVGAFVLMRLLLLRRMRKLLVVRNVGADRDSFIRDSIRIIRVDALSQRRCSKLLWIGDREYLRSTILLLLLCIYVAGS